MSGGTSVGFSTGAVEMGQGVERKLCRVAAEVLGLPLAWMRMESTNTTRVANASPSAASFTADLNGKALHKACGAIHSRLLALAADLLARPQASLTISKGKVCHQGEPTELTWHELVARACNERISLSAQAHHVTPEIHFDAAHAQGHPFAYHVYGTAITQVTLDILRGIYQVDCVKLVHDAGLSLDPLIDRGQIEGGLVQGIGWLTSEELRYSADGRLLTDSLDTYKVPDIHAAPAIEAQLLEQAEEPEGLLQAKAVGEPPFLYGIGTYLALLRALHLARPGQLFDLDAPLSHERILIALDPPA